MEDRGTGIAPDVRNRLFRQMITNKGTHGTGLGVYISNTVIKAKFGGRMWAEDNPGGGAVFGLEIPPVLLENGTDSAGGFSPVRKNKVGAQQLDFSIMTLDDDPIMTATLQAYFTTSGYMVDVETDPTEASSACATGITTYCCWTF